MEVNLKSQNWDNLSIIKENAWNLSNMIISMIHNKIRLTSNQEKKTNPNWSLLLLEDENELGGKQLILKTDKDNNQACTLPFLQGYIA